MPRVAPAHHHLANYQILFIETHPSKSFEGHTASQFRQARFEIRQTVHVLPGVNLRSPVKFHSLNSRWEGGQEAPRTYIRIASRLCGPRLRPVSEWRGQLRTRTGK